MIDVGDIVTITQNSIIILGLVWLIAKRTP